jgi:hypothetical protein
MTITEFLLARIAEDEAIGRDWRHHPGKVEVHGGGTGYIRLANPDRVLADSQAKRYIVELHQRCNVHDRPGDECDTCQRCGDGSIWPCDTLLAVASVYADHPDFDQAWRLTS